jgi:hypothetical protein
MGITYITKLLIRFNPNTPIQLMYKNTKACMRIFILSLFPLLVMAQPLPEVRRLQRCYAFFTSSRIPANNSQLAQVKAGTLTGTQACMQIFDQAQLGSNNQVDTSNAVAVSILRKMQEVHKTFFDIKDLVNIYEIDATGNVNDLYEGANTFTYVLLKPNIQANQLVTGQNSYRAIRNRAQATSSKILLAPYGDLNLLQGPDGAQVAWTPTVVEEGTLVGMMPDTVVNIIATPGHNQGLTVFNNSNVNDHKGAGILGTQSYLLTNKGKNGNPNGTSTQYRRWSRSVMKDFLCRDLPALRGVDISTFIVPSSPIAYRKSESCNRCHANMDPMAGVIRNHIEVRALPNVRQDNVLFMGTRTPTQSSADNYPSGGPDSNYYLRPPEGNLRYRSYDGSLINQSLTNLDDLGTKIAATNDFPVCIAKKYYHALTGIDVSLRDVGDGDSAPLTSGEAFHRNAVISLGLNLKDHQSLRTLIQQIIQSNAFLYPDKAQ